MNRKHYVLSILGMQCVDCENNIHEAILALPGILSAYASFTDELLQIEIDTDIISIKTVRAAIKLAGYDTSFPVRKQKSPLTKRLLLTLLATAGIFFLFQLNQLISLDISLEKVEKDVQYGLIFMVGLLTSFHCIGMCGGFVLSYTATGAKSGHSPHFSHLSYGLAKTLSYTAFGAAFGFVGGAISFTLTMRSVAMLCAGIFLVVYGLEPVQYLRNSKAKKAKLTNCRLVLSRRSVFFQSLRHFSNQAKDRSTTQRWGMTAKVCSSLRLATCTVAPIKSRTESANGWPV